MRFLRLGLVSAVLILGLSLPASAQQTTTTMPPVRSIPVTPASTTATTAAPAATTSASGSTTAATAGSGLADTGFSADKLVPLGLLLIGLGAALTGASRRRRPAYVWL